MEAVNEEEGEMGYSAYSVSDTSIVEKGAMRMNRFGIKYFQIINLRRSMHQTDPTRNFKQH